jgi:hypothetical protein
MIVHVAHPTPASGRIVRYGLLVRARLLSLSAVALGAAALAGCGGGGSSSSATSATDWASGYCSAATTWVTTLTRARADVKTGKATASDAAQTVTNQTNELMKSISGLGTPDTPDGSTSASTADDLAKTLSGRVGRISAAINTNNPDVTVAAQKLVVQEQIAAALGDVASTTTTLEQGDAELGTAMKASADCTKLSTALAAAS